LDISSREKLGNWPIRIKPSQDHLCKKNALARMESKSFLKMLFLHPEFDFTIFQPDVPKGVFLSEARYITSSRGGRNV